MAEDELAITGEIDIYDLNIRIAEGNVVVLGKPAANFAVTALIVDGGDIHVFRDLVVMDIEEAKAADALR